MKPHEIGSIIAGVSGIVVVGLSWLNARRTRRRELSEDSGQAMTERFYSRESGVLLAQRVDTIAEDVKELRVEQRDGFNRLEQLIRDGHKR